MPLLLYSLLLFGTAAVSVISFPCLASLVEEGSAALLLYCYNVDFSNTFIIEHGMNNTSGNMYTLKARAQGRPAGMGYLAIKNSTVRKRGTVKPVEIESTLV